MLRFMGSQSVSDSVQPQRHSPPGSPMFRESQAPCRAVCRPCGFFWMMHEGVSAPSCCAFTHRVAFEEVSGPRVLLKSGPGNRGLAKTEGRRRRE